MSVVVTGKRECGAAEKAADPAAETGQQRGAPDRWQSFGRRLDRFDREVEAVENRDFEHAVEPVIGRFRHPAQHAVDRLAGIFRNARREVRIFEQHNRALERFPMYGQKRVVDLR
jgi:hypothetical protein